MIFFARGFAIRSRGDALLVLGVLVLGVLVIGLIGWMFSKKDD